MGIPEYEAKRYEGAFSTTARARGKERKIMRKVIVSNLASLDGFFEGPYKELDWFVADEEFLEYAKNLPRTLDIGRSESLKGNPGSVVSAGHGAK